ncbi:serine/threonine-protein kinase [Streptomyces niveus]|uniref:serine/threonine-protein kinase n=1 Tax=Streptomyces niveus TaxID=193462 RepID=UPI00084C0854|nr:serine/threonine-protein kinase [Streptomyces niveus]
MQGLGDEDPRQIGRYRLLRRLGAGGMGNVYLARSDRGRTVAIKLVREELAAQEEFRKRFRYEVEAARRVGGHWTAPVLDADTEAAVPWVATGYIAGPSLRQGVGHDHGPLPERSVRTLAAGLAHALRDIHDTGLVHRDLKPANVLITIDGPRVIDFGIARALETVTDGRLTRTGALIGSPGFMAPEQVRSDRITPACDIFCLGSVLAYAATGKMPFGTAQAEAHVLMYRIAHEEPDLEGVPTGLVDLIRDCLEKEPAARPDLGEVLRRTGAQDTVADGSSNEPWLPGPLVAELGRHAVGLLDTDNPEPPAAALPRDRAPGRMSAPVPASVAEALPVPAVAPTGAPASHKRGRYTMLIVALVAGSVVYTLTRGDGDPGGGVMPEEFLGTWTASVNGEPRWMTISQGHLGETLLRMFSNGPKDEGGTYHCEFSSKLMSVADFESVRFSKTRIVGSDSDADCEEANSSELTLEANDTLRRKVDKTSGDGLPWTKLPTPGD